MDNELLEIKSIVDNSKYGYLAIIKTKLHLIQYINNKTKFLADPYFKLSTKIYCVLNNISEFPKCKTCGKEIRKNIRNIVIGFNMFCSFKCIDCFPDGFSR